MTQLAFGRRIYMSAGNAPVPAEQPSTDSLASPGSSRDAAVDGSGSANPPDRFGKRPVAGKAYGTAAPATTTAKRRFEVISNWLSAFAAVAALGLSVITYVQVNRDPELQITVPHIIRVSGSSFYIQPTLSLGNQSDRSAIVNSIYLDVAPSQPKPGARSVRMYWYTTVDYVDVENGSSESGLGSPGGTVPPFRFDSFPAPIIVTRQDPQAPVLLFVGGTDLTTGERWDASIHVKLSDGRDIPVSFCVEVDSRAASDLKEFREVLFRDDLADPSSSGCYVVWR